MFAFFGGGGCVWVGDICFGFFFYKGLVSNQTKLILNKTKKYDV